MKVKVWCAASDCKWCSDDNLCEAKEINLTDNYVHTLFDGFQHFNRCRTYEPDPRSAELEKVWRTMIHHEQPDGGG